jgi:uncharacterized protein with HEPN domain
MQRKSPKLLEDVRDAADYILSVTVGETQNSLAGNRMLRQAVERNFEIIGEAMKRLAHIDSDTARLIGDYPQIIAYRNLLIHGYEHIDVAMVWHVIQHGLPTLLHKAETLLRKSDQDP